MSSLDINRPGSNTDCVPVRVTNNTRPPMPDPMTARLTFFLEKRANDLEKFLDNIRSNHVELSINRPGSNTVCVPNNTRPPMTDHSTSLFDQRWNDLEKLIDSIIPNPVEISIQRNVPDPMKLAIQRHNALVELPRKHRKLLRQWDGLSTLHPEQITSLSKLTIDEIRDMFGIVPAQVKQSTHTFGKLIVKGNSRNNTVNEYINMNTYGELIMQKSCYVVFPTCRTDSIGLQQKVYPKRIFFGGKLSEIPVDHGVFRMISSIEIYESPEFTDTYRLEDDAVELID